MAFTKHFFDCMLLVALFGLGLYENVADVPLYKNWVEEGAVTSVKNQGCCGSSYTFAATTAIESQVYIKTNKPMSLSEQEIIDCDDHREDHGCFGGSPGGVYQFVNKSKGLVTEDEYKYVGFQQPTCRSGFELTAYRTISGYGRVPSNNEYSIKKAIGLGPANVGIRMVKSVYYYDKGVYNDRSCSCSSARDLNHAITVVGYGETDDNKKYWLCKNSWGSDWGDNGYFKIAREVEDPKGRCGIATDVTYYYRINFSQIMCNHNEISRACTLVFKSCTSKTMCNGRSMRGA
ncbi:hypothetical protein Droror1_Dr00013941 [Drosera rotundifolia]